MPWNRYQPHSRRQESLADTHTSTCTSAHQQACPCNDHGLGRGLEAGPRIDKRGSPRGLVLSVVSWLLLVVCGCWYQNGAALFQFSFVVVLSGASCSSSVVCVVRLAGVAL